MVAPRDAADVEAALAACRAHGAPVLGRGCGTGLAGQSVNQAVVFDFSRYMNAIVELDPRRRRARVQPGVICDELRDAAEAHQLTFGPDPATHDHATFGGMIGNNTCGTHSVLSARYGPGPRTSDNVDKLDIVTYDGLRMRANPPAWPCSRYPVRAAWLCGEGAAAPDPGLRLPVPPSLVPPDCVRAWPRLAATRRLRSLREAGAARGRRRRCCTGVRSRSRIRRSR